jgi:hypothetical protein
MSYATDFLTIKDDVSSEEWQTRLELAACYRLVDKYEMTDLIYNHITARIPGSEDQAHLYQPGTRRPYGVLEWPAMIRLLDAEQKNSDYPPYWH